MSMAFLVYFGIITKFSYFQASPVKLISRKTSSATFFKQRNGTHLAIHSD